MAAPTIVTLSFSCQKLADLDITSKSDPMVVVFGKQKDSWQEVGRTETLQNTLNPDFTTLVQMTYKFEEVQHLRFLVIDVDNQKKDLSHQDMLGEAFTTLAAIVAAPGRTLTWPLQRNGRLQGNITCLVDRLGESSQKLKLQFAGVNLDDLDILSKSDPYLIISRMREDGSYVKVHKTEVVNDDLNPVWKEFEITLSQLCNSLVDIPLLIECYDDDFDGNKGDFIGKCQTTARQLIELNPKNWALVNPKKNANAGVAGSLKLLKSSLLVEGTFLDYLAGGCEVSLITAVDFTGSNGPPHEPKSLHFISPDGTTLNQYEAALTAVGSVVAPYDADGLFQMFGFGAKINGVANHCFCMTENPAGVLGVQGMLEAYHQVIHSVELWGPTNFAPVILAATSIASQFQTQQSQKYFVLLILTDGVITDIEDTKSAIIQASYMPLSIIIVGVGSADFTEMNALDSDNHLLQFDGRSAVRDIVQFVPFRDFDHNPEELARVTLAEVPAQLISFFKFAGFVPNPPRRPLA